VACWAKETVSSSPLTLSVVLLSRGAPDPLPPPPRQRTTISSNQSAFRRCGTLLPCFREAAKALRRLLQSPRSTSTTRTSRTPVTHPEVARVVRCSGRSSPFQGPIGRASLDQGLGPAFAGYRALLGCDRSHREAFSPNLVARTPSVASSWQRACRTSSSAARFVVRAARRTEVRFTDPSSSRTACDARCDMLWSG
jgi:hypothetical protein